MPSKEAIIDIFKFRNAESKKSQLFTPEEFDKIELYATCAIEATPSVPDTICLLEKDWCDGDIELIRRGVPIEIRPGVKIWRRVLVSADTFYPMSRKWLSSDFDPEYFDKHEINNRLKTKKI